MEKNIEAAIAAHLAWSERFGDAIAHRVLPEALRTAGYDDQCTFGKWLYGLGDDAKRNRHYRNVKDLHYRFHTEAAEIVRLLEAAFYDEAKLRLGEDFARSSVALLTALREWAAAGKAA